MRHKRTTTGLVLAAATLLVFTGTATAIDLNSSHALQYYGDNQDGTGLDFQVRTTGETTLYGDLDLQNTNDITNFFGSNCGADEVVQAIYANGSYACIALMDSSSQNLSSVLREGNTVGDFNINMSGNAITGLQRLQYDRGVAIGDAATATLGNATDNFTTDTDTEWQAGDTTNTSINNSAVRLETNIIVSENWSRSLDEWGSIAADVDGTIYAATLFNKRLLEYDPTGTLLSNITSTGKGYGVDTYNGDVYVSSSSGDYVTKYTPGVGADDQYSLPSNGRGLAVDSAGDTYVAASSDKLVKLDSALNQVWNTSLVDGIGSDIATYRDTAVYVVTGDLTKYDAAGTELWRQDLTVGGRSVATDADGNVYVTTGDVFGGSTGRVLKFDPSGTVLWDESLPEAGADVAVENNSVYVMTDDGGGAGTLLRFDSAGVRRWSRPLSAGSVSGDSLVVVNGSIFASFDDKRVVRFDQEGGYVSSGTYLSQVFDAGEAVPFNSVITRSQIPTGTAVNVTVQLSNTSDFSSDVAAETVELGGEKETSALNGIYRYARFNVSVIGNVENTPVVDTVIIRYGLPGTIGIHQVALGAGAATSAEGAVAIGYLANAPNPSEATFGNLGNERLDANVTGNLTVHGGGGLDLLNGDLDMQGGRVRNVGGLNGDCPSGYVWVSGSTKFGTMPGFCVMKYEAKKDSSGNPVSLATGTPWTSISQYDARKECRRLGSSYHLITESEWMTIAENVMRQPSNWADTTIGSSPGGLEIVFKGTSGSLKYVNILGQVTNMAVDVSEVGGIGDFDGDGDQDVTFTDSSQNVKYIDAGGNITDTGANAYRFGTAIADFDNDGDKDIAFGDGTSNLNYVDGSGNIGSTGVKTDAIGGIGDVDDDGDMDIAYDVEGTDEDLRYVDVSGNVVSLGYRAFEVGGIDDVDGDGDNDIVFYDADNNNLNYADSVGNRVDTGVASDEVGGIADFDNDGDKEIANEDPDGNIEYVDASGNIGDTGIDGILVGDIGDVNNDYMDRGGLYLGNVAPYASHSMLGYNGSNPDFGTGRNTTARLQLSNRKYIWDISGNVWEWTQGYITTDEVPEHSGNRWTEYTEITNFRNMDTQKPLNPAWDSSQGIGRLNLTQNPSGGTKTDNIHAVKRGGSWNNSMSAGVLSVSLADAPSTSNSGVGFRCSFTPVS